MTKSYLGEGGKSFHSFLIVSVMSKRNPLSLRVLRGHCELISKTLAYSCEVINQLRNMTEENQNMSFLSWQRKLERKDSSPANLVFPIGLHMKLKNSGTHQKKKKNQIYFYMETITCPVGADIWYFSGSPLPSFFLFLIIPQYVKFVESYTILYSGVPLRYGMSAYPGSVQSELGHIVQYL